MPSATASRLRRNVRAQSDDSAHLERELADGEHFLFGPFGFLCVVHHLVQRHWRRSLRGHHVNALRVESIEDPHVLTRHAPDVRTSISVTRFLVAWTRKVVGDGQGVCRSGHHSMPKGIGKDPESTKTSIEGRTQCEDSSGHEHAPAI
jgi:hypothetical protein